MLAQAAQGCAALQRQIAGSIIGQDDTVRALLAAVLAQGHCLIIGVPGLAKTLLVRTLAATLGWSFRRIQFTPDMMPADIIGMEILDQSNSVSDARGESANRVMRFTPGPVFANLVLADEINRTPPKTQSALLEAMQEYTVTSLGRSHAIPRPFIVVATQNPIEQAGTYPLPEAQLDRFMLSLWMDYPSEDDEARIVSATTSAETPLPQSLLNIEQLIAFQALVRRIPATDHVVRYAVALARATRPSTAPKGPAGDMTRQYVEWGAGPRAAQHLILGAKAWAVMEGQPAVSCAHVRRIAPSVLRHRVLPNYAATSQGITADAIVKHVIENVKEPDYSPRPR